MSLQGKRIGMALTGSHCTVEAVYPQMEKLIQAGAIIFPIISPSVDETDTRFGEAEQVKEKLSHITGHSIITTIVEAEPVGPQKLFDVLVIAPCTGNTLAKLANGITDSGVLMAAKAQLRNQRPVVLAIATNDALGLNARNIGTLLVTKNIYLVPLGQDDPLKKPNSLVFKEHLLVSAIEKALQGVQLQPILISPL